MNSFVSSCCPNSRAFTLGARSLKEIEQMDCSVLVVPGIGNSGPSHWQSLWQAAHSDWRRLSVPSWDDVACYEWTLQIERQLPADGRDTVIVAHSLGCLAVVHWVARYQRSVRGALLVAVPDPESPAFPKMAARGFAPLPLNTLPFPTTVVLSGDDPYGSARYARACAAAWGSEAIDVGAKGHINAASDLGDWPEGYALLERIASSR
jgi:predicted alpha/beta hydrolase family esterase